MLWFKSVQRMEKIVTFGGATTITSTTTIPISYDVSELLRSCRSVREMKQIHAFVLKTETRPLQTQKQLYLYNAIIQGLCNNNNSSLEAIMVLYQEMLAKGLVPDTYTIPYLLKACAQSRALREGQQIHAHSIKTALVSNVYVNNTLMRMYAVCGIIKAVRNLFDKCPLPDLVSWTTLIQACVKTGYPRDAIAAFFQMCQTNLRADQMTLVIVLSACSKLGDLTLGRNIHTYIRDNNVYSDVFVGNALVDMYFKCGDADAACKVFDEMPVKNVVSWNSMISGLAQQGNFKQALDEFRKMQTVGVKPDDITLVGVLNACANLGVLELGKWIHAYIDKNQIKADGYVGNALVDLYAKCGCIDQAFGVFQGMKCRDIYSYTAIIVGLAMHGEAQRALYIFSEMPRMGIQPDEVTFVGVLSACSHVGLVEEGLKHFEDMSRVYNLEPQTEHYGCMVDLLGRAGLMSEAQEFIENMPIAPDAFVWGALLGACKIHAKVELGENVLKKLVSIEPGRDGAYILMSNIYSSANRWKDALQLRKAMKDRNMKKTPGCSSIELEGLVHEFRKGDKSHPKSKEVYKVLGEIMSHLKDYGHLAHDNPISSYN